MAKTVILSEDTVKSLLEAHASMAAWYYELARALQTQSAARVPDDATRAAFLARVAEDFPEIAAVARTITAPRMYVPPPPAFTAPAPPAAVPSPSAVPVPAVPAPAVVPAEVPAAVPVAAPPALASPPAVASPPPPPPAAAEPQGAVPPPLVLPGTVKY